MTARIKWIPRVLARDRAGDRARTSGSVAELKVVPVTLWVAATGVMDDLDVYPWYWLQ
jgi:hypothetical protein